MKLFQLYETRNSSMTVITLPITRGKEFCGVSYRACYTDKENALQKLVF
jgi:hypothetical protein